MAVYGISLKGDYRQRNEDSIFINEDLGLYIIADGMGGLSDGHIASQQGIGVILNRLSESMSITGLLNNLSIIEILESAYCCANDEIRLLASSKEQSMGTTLTSALLYNKILYLAHVGDTRAYHFSKGGVLTQLTTDHSGPKKNSLSRAIGIRPQVEVDFATIDVLEEDMFILTTDGFHDSLIKSDMRKLLRCECSLPEKGQLLANAAIERGAKDNVSILLIQPLERRK